MFVTLANKVTFIRILNVPFFILLLLYYKHSLKQDNPYEIFRYFAIAVFLLTIFLDAIDGFLARKRNEISKLGTILDPIADKLLLVSSFIILSGNSISISHHHLPVWFVFLVISRDIVLIAGGFLINYIAGSLKVQSRLFGKAATFFQTTVVTLVLFKIEGVFFIISISLAAVFTLVSGIQYIIDGYHQIENV